MVQDLLRLIRLRNSHPAFNGRFELLGSDAQTLALRWTHNAAPGTSQVELEVDLRTQACRITLRDASGTSDHPLQASTCSGNTTS